MPLKKIDYLPYLEECWQKHLEYKPDNAPTVISLFAGCGGSSLGYSMAGFRELLAVEWDKNAVDTFSLNFDVPIICDDIADVPIEQVLEMTGLQPGQLDILDGSPPCQGFSTAGKRAMNDDRNQLFREYVRLLRGLQPKVFVMENVSGMVKGKMKIIFAEIMRELKASGYKVSARLLNAMWFGVPQSRERMIFIGVRDDLGIVPNHPEAEYQPIILSECLSDCPIGLSDGEFIGKRLEIAKKIIEWHDGSDVIKGQSFNLKRLSWDKPSRTILKSIGKPNSHYGGGLIHPDYDRHINIAELKRINSLPDRFKMIGKYQEQWIRIGNSVPPLFMYAIAKHIRENILSVIQLETDHA